MKNKHITNSKNEIKELTVLMRLKLFHLFSIFPLKSLNSVRLIFSKSVFSNNSLSGILPRIVMRKTPNTYKRVDSKNNSKTYNFVEPKLM